MNILEAMETPDLFGDTFTGESWEAWRAIQSGVFAVPMEEDRLKRFKQLAGGREPPSKRVREVWCIAGRRSAKTHQAAMTAVYIATIGAALEGLTDRLAPGEIGVVALLATDRSQAKVAMRYVAGIIESSPVLRRMIVKRNAESLELSNRIHVEVTTANHRAIRGRTCLAIILDECAFFTDSETSTANDQEIYRAAVPALATTGGLLIGISSPYAKRGLLYQKYTKHYSKDSDILVIKAPTTELNPLLDPRIVEDALAEDPEAAKTEWLAEFRDGLSSFIDRATVEGCTRPFPLIVPRQHGQHYVAFVDPAGGSTSANADQFTLAIGYRDDEGKAVICGVWGRKGAPDGIIEEYSGIIRAYGITKAYSDKYAGQYPALEFKKHGITLEYTKHNRSQLYTEVLPLFNSGRIEIPPDDRLIGQFVSLERKTGRLQDIIDHAPGGHDDIANAVAGAAVEVAKGRRGIDKPIPVHFAI